ncbi:hypothetical protein [Clostridium manihotivorum]|uniref:Uncharacterized protein n=1 Tax=Clostridium manihotivorum TaxID=2320868 RepID=A0A3R5UGY6_9CLOT|nr:hypothetical protein [Clostridium manihotivorum]QAA33476.1 hypothetical protein C1I91_18495 [Clostridium manihotivorum]
MIRKIKQISNFEGGGQRDKALSLTVFNTLVKFNRYAGGAYDGEQNNYEDKVAQLIIDIDTGKVIDVLYPNFYYLYGYRTYTITKPYQQQYGIDVNQ